MMYFGNYVDNIYWDNIYVEEYFLVREKRREKKGQRLLLPLKQTEANKYVTSTTWTRLVQEEKDKVKENWKLCLTLLAVTAIIFSIDFILFQFV